MPGDLLDLILIVLICAFAVAGYRQGFIVGLVSFAGFLGGGAVGATFAPRIARSLASSPAAQAAAAIIVVFVAAMIGQLLASGIGVAVRSRMTWRPAAVLDSVGGAGLSVISVLLIAWLIGSAVAYAPFAVVSREVNNSAVLGGVDRIMPPSASSMFSSFRNLLASGPYTRVFAALGAEDTPNVPPPDPAVLTPRLLSMARASVLRVEGVAPGCSRQIEGSGFVYAAGHVLTNAHVVAGVTQRLEVLTSRDVRLRARVVLYDPRRDIAVLDVPGLRAPVLAFARRARIGASAIVAGYPQLGSGYPMMAQFTAVPARVGLTEDAQTRNIYNTMQVTRQIYQVRARVRPGNSGGPLLTPGGKVYGIVFAAAVSIRDTGYALTAAEVEHDAARGASATAGVSTQGCD